MLTGKTFVLGLAGILTLALGTACAPPQVSYLVSPNGAATTAKAPDCDFEVRATVPRDGYEEIATVVYGSRTLSMYRASRDPEEFKNAIRHDVCAVGGDAVVTQVDAQGTIVRGAVLRRVGGLGLSGTVSGS